MSGLNGQDKENLICEMYAQGKTFRDIQRTVRKSPRDIKAILDKHNNPGQSSVVVAAAMSKSSQAYTMFEQGKRPIDVAIALNLRDPEVNKLHQEYLNLTGWWETVQVYQELGRDIWILSELNRKRKAENIGMQQISKVINGITTLEQQIMNLDAEQARLQAQIRQAGLTFQQFTDLIQKDRKTIGENENIINKQKREIELLNKEIKRFEDMLSPISNYLSK
jgi:hypothetical protein